MACMVNGAGLAMSTMAPRRFSFREVQLGLSRICRRMQHWHFQAFFLDKIRANCLPTLERTNQLTSQLQALSTALVALYPPKMQITP